MYLKVLKSKQMVLNCKPDRLRKWKYSNYGERGYCLGFHWKHQHNSEGYFTYFNITRTEKVGSLIIVLKKDPDESVKNLIENYISDSFDIILEWIDDTSEN